MVSDPGGDEEGGGRDGQGAPGEARWLRRLVERRVEPAGPPPFDTDAVDRRAAVILLLRLRDGLEGLFVRRAEREGDPWSGHVGLPGGHREPGDPDLLSTALRELAEETGLELEPDDVLGRLDDVHPRSQRLPSIAVRPFVGWHAGPDEVRHGPEIIGHRWVGLAELADPGRRSVLTFRRGQSFRAFPAVGSGEEPIWGLTYLIVKRLLSVLPDEVVGRAAGGDGGP